MKILILSDSHSKPIDDIKFKNYDYIFHAGDYGTSKNILTENNVHYVSGNCDFGDKNDLELEINNKKIYMTHGHLYNVKNQYNSLIYKALSLNANICIFGHTHCPEYFTRYDILFINPGAYNDGNYVVIEDDKIIFYKYNSVNKIIDYKW